MNDNTPRILFFGTPQFAVPALEALVSAGYAPALVVTAPDKPVGRKQLLTASPVRVRALELGLPVVTPHKLSELDLAGAWDLFVVVAYGKIIPQSILEIPKHGAVNIHPSLLPLFRGAAPIQGALLAGVEKTGVSLMLLDAEMDHGPLLAQETVELHGHETNAELQESFARKGAELLCRTMPSILNGTAVTTPQDHAKATFIKKISTEDGFIDFDQMSAVEIDRRVRALNPDPGTYAYFALGGKRVRTKILEGEIEDGFYVPHMVQPEGKTPVVWKVFKKRIDQTATSGA